MRLLIAAAIALSSSATVGDQSMFVYSGMCNASAVAFISDDHFVVANDEDNILRVYTQRNRDPISSLDLGAFIDTDNSGRESDIEGATRVGNRIYWISSHGTNKNGKARPERRRIFATDIVPDSNGLSIRPVGNPYAGLIDDLVSETNLDAWKILSGGKTRPPKLGGLNIEGLATSPTGGLLIGLRSPVPMGYAAIIELQNPDDVISGKTPRFSRTRFLNLGDDIGIRAMDQGEKPGSFIIVSGPVSGNPGAFQLLQWDIQMESIKPIKLDFGSLSPEAIVRVPGEAGRLHIVSDDGTRKVGGAKCEDLPEPEKRTFRTIEVRISE
ncbi:Protein of unknown function [Parasphingorhabdus marina DSM 22363]|uniref:DUF3616 domain-containing protein n=2 Tax=Parasphingorhabdus marina TaxID=394732 RepID=A0A1N6D223_9SPHN|nr:Protein of unknown function [Parasphingorhabdus marina DSM 22363]